jgi:hypothetical protein
VIFTSHDRELLFAAYGLCHIQPAGVELIGVAPHVNE